MGTTIEFKDIKLDDQFLLKGKYHNVPVKVVEIGRKFIVYELLSNEGDYKAHIHEKFIKRVLMRMNTEKRPF